jgi:hypothetical protein
MPYDIKRPTEKCTVCTSAANILSRSFGVGEVVDCSRCGDFRISHVAASDRGLPLADRKKQALASYTIRKMQASNAPRPLLTTEFFHALESRSLPTPAEASDNLVLWLAERADGSPGTRLELYYSAPELLSTIGVVGLDDVTWIVRSLTSQQMIQLASGVHGAFNWTGYLTAQGWKRVEDLRRAHISSKFAFFARQFDNPDLDSLFEACLRRAVQETGYELRTATQRAGLIDAVIEDEIRRCRFVVADLSDGNAGAYWEAGFAEGLGKDVIYICRATTNDGARVETHFDTDHRQRVRWDLAELDRTATDLRALIRNTLLGDANQSD